MGNFEQFRAICNVNYFFPLPAVEYHPAKMGILWILDYGSRIPFGNGVGLNSLANRKTMAMTGTSMVENVLHSRGGGAGFNTPADF